MVVAVLDASALVGAKNRIALQIAMNRRQFIGVWSPWIIEEMARTLTWHWARQRGMSVEAKHALSVSAKLMMDILTDTFIAVDPKPPHPPTWPELRDAGDWPLWATAKLADAQYVVSENTRDFPPRDAMGQNAWEGITYLTTADFLAQIEGGKVTPPPAPPPG